MVNNKKFLKNDLDRIDNSILSELQKDGRISNIKLSRRVGLSPTPCLERVRRLERKGFICGYTAILNPLCLGASLLMFIEVILDKRKPNIYDQFNDTVKKLEEIQECHLISGDFDYLLKVRILNTLSYRKFLNESLSFLPGIKNSRTYIVMEEIKQNNFLIINKGNKTTG